MLVQVCLLVLSVGAYASTGGSESPTEDPLFKELDLFPENFLSKFPQGEFFRTKIITYLFFNLFSKYFAESEPIKFWSKFNRDDFNRVAIDAVFYEYLTQFADRGSKDAIFNPLASSVESSTEDVAIDRVGEYLDSLTTDEVPTGQSGSQVPEEDSQVDVTSCASVPVRDPSFGVPGKDFPGHCGIPRTSFTCADKLVPGVYADIEAGCQVFHACWPDRVDSFLCPIGTTFNQAELTCDFWHESECSSSPLFFDSPIAKSKILKHTEPTIVIQYDDLRTTPELDIPEYDGTCESLLSKPLQLRMKFLPAKCRVSIAKKTTLEKSKADAKIFAIFADLITAVYKDTVSLVTKAVELGARDVSKKQGVSKRSKLSVEELTPEPLSTIVDTDGEVVSTSGEMNTVSEEPTSYTTTEKAAGWKNPGEGSPTKPPSPQENSSRRSMRSAPLKSTKLSEDSKKHALDIVMRAIEMGGDVLSDNVFPFVEKLVVDSSRKMSKNHNYLDVK